jgi:hypothetical protein
MPLKIKSKLEQDPEPAAATAPRQEEAPDSATPTPSPPSALPHPAGPALVERNKYEDIARMLLMGTPLTDIAVEIGKSPRTLRRILRHPTFVAVHSKVAEEFWGNLDKVLLDEKIRPLQRAQAQAVRAQTLLSETIEEVRSRIADGSAKATDLRVGVDASFGVIDRSKNEMSTAADAKRPAQINQFNIATSKRALLKATIDEAGLDLSDLDIIDVTPSDDATPDLGPASDETDHPDDAHPE